MAEFCKIRSDGSVMAAPNPLRIVVSNPSDERYRYEGWLETCGLVGVLQYMPHELIGHYFVEV